MDTAIPGQLFGKEPTENSLRKASPKYGIKILLPFFYSSVSHLHRIMNY